jgi:hypothetical protein
MTEEENRNEEVRQHVRFMKGLGFWLKYGLCMVLVVSGWFFLLQTKGAFGDVPMVLGVLGVLKILRS